MRLEELLESEVNRLLDDDRYFLVEVRMSQPAGRSKIVVLLDGDDGVNIDYCAQISRQLAAKIEENNWIEQAYTLEVSSPGIDFPLQTKRQYLKNVGRKVKIKLKEGRELKGLLQQVNDEDLQLVAEVKEKGKKKVEEVEMQVPLSSIEKTQVLVSFK